MIDESATVMVPHSHPSVADRVTSLTAWGLAVALFLTVGWFAVAPDDPLGPVSLLARRGAVSMWLQAIALSAVAAAVATLIAGRRIPDIGTLAAAIGLTVVSFRGGTAEWFLLGSGDQGIPFQRTLAAKLAVESAAWFVVVAVAIASSGLVLRWCYGSPANPAMGRARDQGSSSQPLSAGFDIPRFSSRFLGIASSQQTRPMDGVKHLVIAAGVGLAASGILSAGLSARSIRHGQACFVTAGAVFLGVYAASRLAPVRSALWGIGGAALIAVAGLIWSALWPMGSTAPPPNIPVSHFLRVLPIQFIAVGTAAAVLTFGYCYEPPATPDPRRQ